MVGATYTYIGCYEDQKDIRAISGSHKTVTGVDRVQACFEWAKSFGNTVFAVQSGDQCFTSSTAADTYNIYGLSTECDETAGGEQTGGGWANAVYQIGIGSFSGV